MIDLTFSTFKFAHLVSKSCIIVIYWNKVTFSRGIIIAHFHLGCLRPACQNTKLNDNGIEVGPIIHSFKTRLGKKNPVFCVWSWFHFACYDIVEEKMLSMPNLWRILLAKVVQKKKLRYLLVGINICNEIWQPIHICQSIKLDLLNKITGKILSFVIILANIQFCRTV